MGDPQTVLIVVAVLAAIGGIATYSAGRSATRHATRGVREVTRLTAAAVRALTTAAVITGVQWWVVTHVTDTTVLVAVLAVPALFAGASVARLLAVTEIVHTTHRAGGRR